MSEAYLNSKACFRARALELGMEEAAVEKATAEGIGTMGGFGFACQGPPGQWGLTCNLSCNLSYLLFQFPLQA